MAEPPSVNLHCMPKAMENVGDWCGKIHGVQEIPMAYMTRGQLMPGDEDEKDSDEFDSLDDEMIERAPIIDLKYEYDPDTKNVEDLEVSSPFTTSFQMDQVSLYHKLHEVFGNLECWTHARTNGHLKCGRTVWKLL